MGRKKTGRKKMETKKKATVSQDLDTALEAPPGLIPGRAEIGKDGLPKGLPTGPIVGRDYKEKFDNDLPEDIKEALNPESKQDKHFAFAYSN